mgnify:CR=1 FL=1
MKRKYLIFPMLALGAGLWSVGSETVADEEKAAPSRAKALASSRMIDARIDQAIYKASLQPAPQAEKEEIVRRLSLDLNGAIPSSQTIVKYLKSRKKRQVEHPH